MKTSILFLLGVLIIAIALSGCPAPSPPQSPECAVASDCPQNPCMITGCVDNKCVLNEKCPSPEFSGCQNGNCIKPAVCGDGKCEANEKNTCPEDCVAFAKETTCDSPYVEKGLTGKTALPRVRFYWGWGDNEEELPIDSCEPDSKNPIYCDPVQFTITLMKRLKIINDAKENNSYSEEKFSKTLNFQAMLIGDNYNENFFHDFLRDQEFLSAPDWFTNPQSLYRNLLLGNNLVFNPEKITSGFYKVEIQVSEQIVSVNLTKLGDAEKNPFYYLPINGKIGLSGGRGGYGMRITQYYGDQIRITETDTLQSSSGETELTVGTIDYLSGLSFNRGLVFELENRERKEYYARLKIDGEESTHKEYSIIYVNGKGKYSGETIRVWISSIYFERGGGFFSVYGSNGSIISSREAGIGEYLNKVLLDNEGQEIFETEIIFLETKKKDVPLKTARMFKSNPIGVLAIADPEKNERISYSLIKNNNPVETGTRFAMWDAFSAEKECKNITGGSLPTRSSDFLVDYCREQKTLAYKIAGKDFDAESTTKIEISQGKVFYNTVVYVPDAGQFFLMPCENGNIFATKNAKSESSTRPIALEDSSNKGQITSIKKIFELVEQEKICVTKSDGTIKFYWNEKPIIEEIKSKAAELSGLQPKDCVPKEKKGLIGFYKFESSTRDLSGNENDLRFESSTGGLSGNENNLEKPEEFYEMLTSGKTGLGVYFFGEQIISGYYTDLRGNSTTDAYYREITVSSWIKDPELSTERPIMAKGSAEKQDFEFLLSSGPENVVSFSIAGENSNGEKITDKVFCDFQIASKDHWQLFTGVFNGNKISVFLNGTLCSEKETQIRKIEKEFPMLIGSWNNAFFRGSIDEVRIYNMALTNAEVKNLYEEEEFSCSNQVGRNDSIGWGQTCGGYCKQRYNMECEEANARAGTIFETKVSCSEKMGIVGGKCNCCKKNYDKIYSEIYKGDPNKTPIVLNHGFSGNHETMWAYAKFFIEKGHTALIWDFPGHWSSANYDNKKYSISNFSDDLHQLLQEEGIQKPIIVGYSLGGMVAINYALKHPDNTSGLILIATTHDGTKVAGGALEIAANSIKNYFLPNIQADEKTQKPIVSTVSPVTDKGHSFFTGYSILDFGVFNGDGKIPKKETNIFQFGVLQLVLDIIRTKMPVENLKTKTLFVIGTEDEFFAETINDFITNAGANSEKTARRQKEIEEELKPLIEEGEHHNIIWTKEEKIKEFINENYDFMALISAFRENP